MQPLGRKFYKNKTGGKHSTKTDGKTSSWWEDIVHPNKTADKVANKIRVEDIYLDCPQCGDYTPDGSWCDNCLDEIDIDAHEEARRERLFEEQEE